MKLRIKDWNRCFETAKSRTYAQCTKVCLPNKMGLGLKYILSLPDGSAIFGNFVLIVEACSTQRKPRRGYLTDDGKANGRSWTYEDIAIRILRPIEEVERCITVCMSARVDWIEDLEQTPKGHRGIRAVSSKHPLIESVYLESVCEEKQERAAHVSARADAASRRHVVTDNTPPKNGSPTGFEKFWALLPPQAKDRSSRKRCLASWTKLKLESKAEHVLKVLEKWKRSAAWLREDGRYIPGAHRWLNDEKFSQEPAEGNGAPPTMFDDDKPFGEPQDATEEELLAMGYPPLPDSKRGK